MICSFYRENCKHRSGIGKIELACKLSRDQNSSKFI